jgi:diacylglycerol kinase family enzyme
MKFAAVLNRDGGTFRTIDLEAFSIQMRDLLEKAGHSVEIRIVAGKDIVAALDDAAAKKSIDVVLAGGGDGTISTAAGRLMDGRKALAILPAGTMNLFARSLGIPLTLNAAVESFAAGEIREIDIASANGRPFVHQFSIGMHAKMVRLRSKMEFGSRFGKIRASARAAYGAFMSPPAMAVTLTIGEAEIMTRTTGIGVTNNLFGEGHLPYTDTPDGGVLGIYVTVAKERTQLLRFFVNVARGRWRDNDQVEIHQAEKVVLKIRSPLRKLGSVIDGELCKLDSVTTLEIHPKALRVLVPAAKANAKKAA